MRSWFTRPCVTRPGATRLTAAALLLMLCHSAADQSSATVVRDAGGNAANPAVETGGHPLPPQPLPAVPYSLIGALAKETTWMAQCLDWPWTRFGWFSPHRRHPPGSTRTKFPERTWPNGTWTNGTWTNGTWTTGTWTSGTSSRSGRPPVP